MFSAIRGNPTSRLNSTDLGRLVTPKVMMLMRGSMDSRDATQGVRITVDLQYQADQGACDAEVEEETDDVGDGCDHHRRGDRGVVSDTPQE